MLITSSESFSKRLLVGIPMTGLIRAEWAMGRWNQIIPCNFALTDCIQWIDQNTPLGFLVADARNIVVHHAIKGGFEWLWFIDQDVVLPQGTLIHYNDCMIKGDVPVIGGLYFTKSVPSEPLVYRGRGNGYYDKWNIGDKVWVDGMGMGCTLIHTSILKVMYEECEEYKCRDMKIKKVFETPRRMWFDPEYNTWRLAIGTEDLDWCNRVIEGNVLERAGWKKFQKKKYPFLIDTRIFCKHIDNDGIQYPSRGEEFQFMRVKENVSNSK